VIAAHAGFANCRACGLLNRALASRLMACARCGAKLHVRKPGSIARSWALLLAAALLYLPANLMPVMQTGTVFGSQSDTIMSGVLFLWTSGSWPLALVVFVASVAVPLTKLIALACLLVSVQYRSRFRPVERARVYRVVEFIGRWSMVDIYVVALLVALVQFDALATVHAGPGAVAFGAVVVLTMLATLAFDPRLIWDCVKEEERCG